METTAPSRIQKLRDEVKTMRRSRTMPTESFRELAAANGKKVKRARYCNLDHIMSDCMAMVHGRWVMTLENLQYYPCKFYYYELD